MTRIKETCAVCGRGLVPDEIAITRKLINRGTHTFYCKDCLASRFEISRTNIDIIIERYKRQGCTLFQQAESETEDSQYTETEDSESEDSESEDSDSD